MKKKIMQTFLVFASFDLFAQVSNIHPDYEIKYEPLSHFVSMNESIESGESYDPATGLISFANTDISLPGNSDLKVELRRVLSVGKNSHLGNNEFGVWSIDTPFIMANYLDGPFSQRAEGGWLKGKHCSGDFQQIQISDQENSYFLSPLTYWSGKLLHIPGETTEKFVKNSQKNTFYVNGQVTEANYGITKCTVLSDGQEGIEVTGPNGVIYSFTEIRNSPRNGYDTVSGLYRHSRKLLATKVKDRFGNFVNYTYENIGTTRRLTKIESNDGRKIEIKYNGFATQVIANNRTWKYSYHNGVGQLNGRLKYVTLPDNTFWEYSYSLSESLMQEPSPIKGGSVSWNGVRVKAGSCIVRNPNTIYSFSIKTPQGLLKEYKTRETYFGRTNVSPDVIPFKIYPKDEEVFVNFNCNVNNSLISKKISGFGVEAIEYSYDYSQNTGLYTESGTDSHGAKANARASGFTNNIPSNLPSNISDPKNIQTTTIKTPKNQSINYYDRDSKSENFGKLIAVDKTDLSGRVLERKEFKYIKGSYFGDAWYTDIWSSVGHPHQKYLSDEYRINKTFEKITLNNDDYITEYSDYDDYGYFRLTREYNSVNLGVKITRRSFKHEPYKYIFGLPTVTELSSDGVNFTKIQEITYHDFSNTGLYHDLKVPYELREFGVWKVRNTKYHSNGMVNRIEFNHHLSNSTTTNPSYQFVEFNEFKAGLPQKITFPSAEEISDSKSSINTVTYSRLIDQNGWTTEEVKKTGLKISYKYDDMGRVKLIDYYDPTIADVNVNYDLNGPDYSISQIISRGAYRKKTDLDALNRVFRESTWDNDFIDTTKVTTIKKYDSMGLIYFTSNPSFSENEPTGTFTEYDELGRLVKQRTNSTNDEITYDYPKSNVIEIVNARNYKTITKYLNYGTPENKLPAEIKDQLNNLTKIQYNIFNNIEEINQNNVIQKYKYNSRQLQCLAIIPETGITVTKYYDSGKVKSQGDGLYGYGQNCEDYTHIPPRFVEYQYNNSGLISKTKYFDGTPERNFIYDPMGRLIILNSGKSIWSYIYNNRDQLETESLAIDNLIFEQNYKYNNLEEINEMKYLTIDSSTQNTINSLSINIENYSVGNIKKIYDSENIYADKISYHPNGVISSFFYGNNLKYSSTLDAKLRVENFEIRNPLFALHSSNYEYDENDNLKSITDNHNHNHNISLTYDELDRISTGNSFWGSGSFTYEGIGNIKTKTLNDKTTSYIYDSNTNRLKQFGNRLFSYDDMGNVTDNGLNKFSYNIAKQLIGSGTNISYVYDGYNRRVKQLKGVNNTYSVYNLSGKLVQRLSNDKTSTYTLYIGDQLLAEVDVNSSSAPPPSVTPPPSSGSNTAPVVNLSVIETLVPSEGDAPDCQKNMICQYELVPKYNYGWTSSNATSCNGELERSSSGVSKGTVFLSGTTGSNSVTSTGDGSLFTMSIRCTGGGGTTTKTISFGGVGSEM